jgi:hypothetical protein
VHSFVAARHSTYGTQRTVEEQLGTHKLTLFFAPILRTLGILALGHVDVQGAPGTVNCQEVPCLTGKTYEQIFLDLRHFHLRTSTIRVTIGLYVVILTMQ